MANNVIKRTWNQNKMVCIEDLSGMAFQSESGGHTFEISGTNDSGTAVSLSGTVEARFLRADNVKVTIAGTISSGKASVTLTSNCYTVAGRFSLTIFVTSNSQKVAVYSAVGNVAVTDGVSSGTVPPLVTDSIQTGSMTASGDVTVNGVLDVTKRRCYASLSSAGWYRVLTITNMGQAGTSWTIDLNITRAYNNTNNEAHSIKLLGVYNSFSFADEVSKSNVIGIDKIRYTRNGDVGYVDIHYSLNVGNDVAVDFDVHAPYAAQRYFTARSLEVVADAPSGETVLTECSFAKYTEGDVSSSFSSSKGTFGAFRCGKMVTVTFVGDSATWTDDEVFGAIGSDVIPALSNIDAVGYIGRQAVVVRLNQNGNITLWIGPTLTGNQRLYFSCTYPIL